MDQLDRPVSPGHVDTDVLSGNVIRDRVNAGTHDDTDGVLRGTVISKEKYTAADDGIVRRCNHVTLSLWRLMKLRQTSLLYVLHVSYFLVLAVLGTLAIFLWPRVVNKYGHGTVFSTDAGRDDDDERLISWVDAMYTAVSAVTLTGLMCVRMETLALSQKLVVLALSVLGSQAVTSLGPVAAARRRLHDRIINHDRRAHDHSHDIHVDRDHCDKLLMTGRLHHHDRDHYDKLLMTARVEYEALGIVRTVVTGYVAAAHVLGYAAMETGLTLCPPARRLLRRKGIPRVFFAAFSAASAFGNSGFSLLDDSLVQFSLSPPLLLALSALILMGNALFPPCLRLLLWLLHESAPHDPHSDTIMQNLIDRTEDHLQIQHHSAIKAHHSTMIKVDHHDSVRIDHDENSTQDRKLTDREDNTNYPYSDVIVRDLIYGTDNHLQIQHHLTLKAADHSPIEGADNHHTIKTHYDVKNNQDRTKTDDDNEGHVETDSDNNEGRKTHNGCNNVDVDHKTMMIPRRCAYAYLLRHPRRCYTHLFPRQQTLWLVGCAAGLTAVQVVALCLLDWRSEAVGDGVMEWWQKLMDITFQSVANRNAGFNVLNIALLSPPVLILYIGLMYISIYPVFLTRQSTMSIPSGKSNKDPRIIVQARKLLARDSTYLFLSFVLICVIEKENIIEDPLNYSIFNMVFEIMSAYGNVGLSIGYNCQLAMLHVEKQKETLLQNNSHQRSMPQSALNCKDVPYSFSGKWSNFGKIVLTMVMLIGRHRGLPNSMDSAFHYIHD